MNAGSSHRSRSRTAIALFLGLAILGYGAYRLRAHWSRTNALTAAPLTAAPLPPFEQALLSELERQSHAGIAYKDGYFRGGDPPPQLGVCTDVVLRAYRAAGVDLPRLVAEDIRAHSAEYHIVRPDPNIDQRRCRNLVVFFDRHAASLPANVDWQVGDIVFWDTWGNGKIDHVGMVGNRLDSAGNRSVYQHLPGNVVTESGDLTRWPIRRHFRWKRG